MTNALTLATPDALLTIAHELERDPRLKSVNTRRGYIADLTAFEHWRRGQPMTKLLVEEYAAALQTAGRSPNGINRALAAVRWWARRLGDLAYEEPTLAPEVRQEITTQAARVAAVRDVKGDRKPRGRHMTQGELKALIQACQADSTPAGVRDTAIIAVAWQTGARRSELAGLQLADYVVTGDNEGTLSIHGKGDKTRPAYIFNGAAAALADWLSVRGDQPGALFLTVLKGGHVQSHGMSDDALARMLENRREQTGLQPLTWHDFRRSFAGNLLDNGHDLVTVQKLMGHVSPTTTSNYDRRGEETKRRAVKSLYVPYH
jgi:site-specific recombinase XerD